MEVCENYVRNVAIRTNIIRRSLRRLPSDTSRSAPCDDAASDHRDWVCDNSADRVRQLCDN